MTSGSSFVKKTARASLKTRWTASIFATCVLVFTFFISLYSISILSIISGNLLADILFCLLCVFIISPLFLGTLRFFWRAISGQDDSPLEVFYYISDSRKYKRALFFTVYFASKLMIYGFLLSIPTFILYIITNSYVYELIGLSLPVWTANLTNVKIILEIVSKVVLFSIMLKFYLAPMLFVSDDNMHSGEAMHMSSVISKKSAVDFIYLGFSFIFWIILSFLVIPIIFVFPYMFASYLVHSKFAVMDYNSHIEQLEYNTYPSYMV